MTDMAKVPDTPPRTVAMRAAVSLLITAGLAAAAMVILGDGAYLWIKAIHVIAIISWMAGMLYLPRLFIYHCDAEKGSVQSETFKVMERRLYRLIVNPAMVISWVLGLWLGYVGGHFGSGWFHAKLALAVCCLRRMATSAARCADSRKTATTSRPGSGAWSTKFRLS